MKIVLSILIPVLLAVAKALGVDNLTPDLVVVGAIVPIVTLVSFIPVIGANGVAKAALAVVIGVAWEILKHPVGLSLPLQIITGIASGLMASGLWSAGKATLESFPSGAAKPTVV